MPPVVILASVLALLQITLSGQGAANRGAPGLAIIIHRSNPVENLTLADLRKILLLERQSWPHGRKITIVMRDSGQPERDSLLKEVCGMSDGDYLRHVLQATFRGTTISAPRVISTSEGMRRFIFNAPGAVGYLRADEVDDTVKVVRIDGRLPGDSDYALAAARRPPPRSRIRP